MSLRHEWGALERVDVFDAHHPVGERVSVPYSEADVSSPVGGARV